MKEAIMKKYTQGHTVLHALRAGGLRPERDTQGHVLMPALRAEV